eukprot:NODE_8218_length_699_cov_21.496528_g7596_i0.p1 GENE.NODE_8218_length_699_cov_21.496528_g7596_i0~~NODE_8218_length_699_cov_21.496528_g7596_i0.p1  ORF type:complete len:197 (+),score=41.78 NODE_8218_length_699_cov_21.496528_g7596_i0:60-593(+)
MTSFLSKLFQTPTKQPATPEPEPKTVLSPSPVRTLIEEEVEKSDMIIEKMDHVVEEVKTAEPCTEDHIERDRHSFRRRLSKVNKKPQLKKTSNVKSAINKITKRKADLPPKSVHIMRGDEFLKTAKVITAIVAGTPVPLRPEVNSEGMGFSGSSRVSVKIGSQHFKARINAEIVLLP